MTYLCAFCGKPVSPSAKTTLRSIEGWEEKRTQGGAHMIHLRHETGRYAHVKCVEERKPRRTRVIP